MKGFIHSFQTLGAVDGPGLRFVVFLQGCNLRCLYCHNPDTWAMGEGMEYAASDVFSRAQRYQPYFGNSGGITVSGGEPLLQAEFVYELLSLCKEIGIHTCLDTSGQPVGTAIEKLLDVTDLCLLDIKATSDEAYQALCGTDLQTPLCFLQLLDQKGIATWIRQVVVPGRNDSVKDIEALNALLKPYSCIQKVELLPFQTLCVEKYRSLNIPFPLTGTPDMDEKKLQKLQDSLAFPH